MTKSTLKQVPILTEQQREVLNQKITEIANAIQPEKIICFSARNKVVSSWGCFIDLDASLFTDCHLLIIIRENDRRKLHDIAEEVEKFSGKDISIYPVVHSIEFVNRELEKGNAFFRELYHHGAMLWDNNETLLYPPDDILPPVLETTEAIWQQWHELGLNFCANAMRSIRNGNAELALFHVHQAAEHTCYGLIRTLTGYRPTTQSIPRLLALTKSFTSRTVDIFPANTEEEKKLLHMFDNGYSEAGYQLDFSVTFETVSSLLKRVCQLQKVAEQLYHQRINSVSTINAKV